MNYVDFTYYVFVITLYLINNLTLCIGTSSAAPPSKMATLESAITGAIASAMANTVVYPLDLSKTLIQTQVKDDAIREEKLEEEQQEGLSNKNPTVKTHRKYDNAIDCMIHIVKHKGFTGLYQGLSTSVFGTFILNFCYFFWYTFFRRRYINLKLRRSPVSALQISTFEELAVGIVAASMSQILTSPIAVINTRQQTVHNPEEAKLVNVIKQVYKEGNGNITAFWKGLKVGLILTLNPSITYASYQRLKKILFASNELSGSESLSVLQNFLLGVISKSISTIVTQPLIVAKTSLQKTGSQFNRFEEVIIHLYKTEGLRGLWKGLAPQLTKGVLVQGLLFAFRGELTRRINKLLFILSFVINRRIKQ